MNAAEPWAHPIFRWAGSKRKLLPTLLRCLPVSIKRYIEPFAGSACLFFALRPRAAILGDMNSDLIHAYDVIRRHPRQVARACASLLGDVLTYSQLRALDPVVLDDVQRATRFLYLNRHCFNGVYRTNKAGAFNVPRGHSAGLLPSEASLYRCSFALRNADLRAVDFEACIDRAGRGDLIYLDPPYANADRPRYGEYGYGSFSTPDLDRLFKALGLLDRRGATFLLSYQDVDRLDDLPKHWPRRRLLVRRHVAGFARHRGIVPEVLLSNRSFPDDS